MKTHRLAFVLLIGLYSHSGYSQTPNWQWAGAGVCSSLIAAGDIATDMSGNSYIVGAFDAGGGFNTNIVFGTYNLLCVDWGYQYNGYIAKYDPLGNVIWAKMIPGDESDDVYITSVSTDVSGNVFVAGYLDGDTVYADSIILTNPNPGTADMFIVKYDSSGKVIWADIAGGSGNNYPVKIHTDAMGDVFLTGEFAGSSIIFGNDSLYNASAIFLHEPEAFIVKYDKNGNVIWAASAGSPDGYSGGLCADNKGNAYVNGYFVESTMIFGSDTLTNALSNSVFVAKYDSAGIAVWARTATGNAWSSGACTDTLGHVYLTGYFSGTNITFDSIILTNASPDSNNIFIAKYDSAGNVLWAVSAGGKGNNVASGIVTDAQGNIYLTGSFTGQSIILGNDTLYSINPLKESLYISKYDTSGHLIWAKIVSGTGSEVANAISMGPDGSPYIGGYYQNAIVFGTETLAYAGFQNVFIAKLDTANHIIDTTTGIKPINLTSPITVYPNPSTGSFYFSGLTEGSTIEVYDMMGQRLNTTSPQPLSQGEGLNSRVLDLSGSPAGVYFYRVIDQGETVQQGKLVVE